MGIEYNEVKYYKSKYVDFSDDTKNGLGLGTIVENDKMNGIFDEITATERENGVIKRIKLFVSNQSVGRTMKRTLLNIKQDVYSPDMLKIYQAKENDHVVFSFVDDQNGEDSTIEAGTELDISILDPIDAVAGDIEGRHFVVNGALLSVESAPSDTSVKFNEDITVNISKDDRIISTDDFDYLESDEDFDNLNPIVNSVIRSTVASGDKNIKIPRVDADYFNEDDNVVLTNEFYRTVFRGTVSSVSDDSDDDTLSIIELDKQYNGPALPENRTSICNAIEFDLPDGREKSFWAELNIQAVDSVQSEVISQFQIGLHFDDVAS